MIRDSGHAYGARRRAFTTVERLLPQFKTTRHHGVARRSQRNTGLLAQLAVSTLYTASRFIYRSIAATDLLHSIGQLKSSSAMMPQHIYACQLS